jgi:hypothetical protein
MKKKDQQYQPLGQLVDDVVDGVNFESYQDDPRPPSRLAVDTDGNSPGSLVVTPRSYSSQDHPLQNGIEDNNLRMRRPLSREGSQEKMEGMGSHLESGRRSPTPPRPNRILDFDKNSNTEVSLSSSGQNDEQDSHSGDDGSGDDENHNGNGLFQLSRASSFDLLDDEDEINLQRYHRDFGASPFASNLHDDFGWNNEHHGMENSSNMYHPRTESSGSQSKDPWIRMVQQHNQHSPTHAGNISLSSVHSLSDLLLYLQRVRRQARQRRAQRLLTMPSEQWWERLQFLVMTYCWDATDVGLLVIAILLVLWFTGLLWLARINAREEDAAQGRESHTGAEYNGNAEFDEYAEYEEKGGRSWRIMFQWLWWGLGVVLLVRILGPLTVYNVNNRRRERRRRRFMSGNMQDQQRRMQQQQLPTIIHSENGTSTAHESSDSQSYSSSPDDNLSGVEITGRGASVGGRESPAHMTTNAQGDPMNLA